jgi:hypothetical protein
MSWAKKAGLSDGCFSNHVVFAEIASRECPIQVIEWGRCTFDQAKYDTTKKTAEAVFSNTTPTAQRVIVTGPKIPTKILLGEKPLKFTRSVDQWGKSLISFDMPPGTHSLVITGFE